MWTTTTTNDVSKPDLAQPILVSGSVPAGLSDVSTGQAQPHPESRGFMQRIQDFGKDLMMNTYGGLAKGFTGGAKWGVMIGGPLMILGGGGLFVGAAILAAGTAGGLALGAAAGVVEGTTNLFRKQPAAMFRDNQEFTVKGRYDAISKEIGPKEKGPQSTM